jgi:hypothetical protein
MYLSVQNFCAVSHLNFAHFEALHKNFVFENLPCVHGRFFSPLTAAPPSNKYNSSFLASEKMTNTGYYLVEGGTAVERGGGNLPCVHGKFSKKILNHPNHCK